MNDKELLDFIVCPLCKGKFQLVDDKDKKGYYCQSCQVVYPIEDGIPMLLPESGIPLAKWEEKK